jgi:hypothetical protein
VAQYGHDWKAVSIIVGTRTAAQVRVYSQQQATNDLQLELSPDLFFVLLGKLPETREFFAEQRAQRLLGSLIRILRVPMVDYESWLTTRQLPVPPFARS